MKHFLSWVLNPRPPAFKQGACQYITGS